MSKFVFTAHFQMIELGIFGYEFWGFRKLPKLSLVHFTIREEKSGKKFKRSDKLATIKGVCNSYKKSSYLYNAYLV